MRGGMRRFAAVLLLAGTPLAATGQPTFTDVTAAAGVAYVQFGGTDPSIENHPIYMSGGAAAGDVNGDGCVDLYVTRLGPRDFLFLNQCNGTFAEGGVAAGLTVQLLSNGAAFGDVDNDGDLDLYVTSLGSTRYHLFINNGSGQFTEQAVARGAAISGTDPHFGFSVSFGDYDRDGWLDIHVGEWRHAMYNPTAAPSNARLLRNRGIAQPGHFDDVTASAGVVLDGIPGTRTGTFPFSPRISDLDNDGWPDLVLTSDFEEGRLFWNDADGTFSDGTVAAGVGTDENGMGAAIADFDGDGLLDYFVTSIYDSRPECPAFVLTRWGCSGNRLFRNLGNRTFADVTDTHGVRDGGWGWGAAFFDYDNDGDPDLVMTNGQIFPFQEGTPSGEAEEIFHDDPMRLWRNDGAGAWPEVAASSGITHTGSGKGLLTFDYDADGDLDLFVVTNSGQPVLYRNDGGNDNDWLRVKVVGRSSTKEGIGARVEVRATPVSPVRMQEVDAGSHFLGQSEKTLHFGLGPGTPGAVVHQVTVVFPSGRTRTLEFVSHNTTVEVVEPKPGCGLLGIEAVLVVLLAGPRTRRRRPA
jgi:hypothetical protein